MVPGNALEHALVAAATDASARPLFYRLLLESPLLILDASPGPPLVEGSQQLEKGTRVQAVCVDVGGVPHTAVFSSRAALQASLRTEQKYISMLGRDLLQLVRGSHLLLNPGADYGKQILPNEIDAILSGEAQRGYVPHVVQKDTQVLLGQPAKPPTHLMDALSSLFRSRADVGAAHLALCSWPESGEQRLMVGITTTGDWEALMREVSATLEKSARPEEAVDFIRMDDSSLSRHLGRTRPFYKKKWLGLF